MHSRRQACDVRLSNEEIADLHNAHMDILRQVYAEESLPS